MNKRDLPANLVLHVTAICGEKGEAWLRELPAIITELERAWSIVVDEPFAAGEFNFVAPATGPDGALTVLKIAPPFVTNEIIGEANYLRHRDGHGAVRLVDEDPVRRAILIERALPGKNLAERFAGNEPGAVQPAIDVMRCLLVPPSPADRDGITTLDHWFDGLRRHGATDFPGSYAAKALEFYETLSTQRGREAYLHGDFHPGNVVTARRSPYLAIDPKGIIGHVGYDIAVFLNNFHWWQEGKPDIYARLDMAITQFSKAFEIDPLELRQWAFAQMVLGAWWNFDEMPQHYDNEVAKADIWNV